jgi:hypothetical protein
MSDPPAKSPPPSGMVAGIIDRVLTFVDAPWKAVAVVGVVLTLGLGWVVYEKRDTLLEVWLTPDTPELKTDLVPEALLKLSNETSADLVQIWAVDLSSNSQWFIGARNHDGERPVIPSPRRLPIIVHTSDVRSLIDVLEGQPTCVNLDKSGSPLARRLAERGMARGCAVPIPLNPEAFVGVIYLAWSKTNLPDTSQENVAVGAAREIARKLATH